MTVIRIELFGAPRVSVDSLGLLPPFPTQRATSLFAFLVVHRGQFYARETLAGIFCGERPDTVALKHLRTDLWRIRDTLRRAGEAVGGCLVVEPRRVGFAPDFDYWLDVQEFERGLETADGLRQAGDPSASRFLDRAIGLYRGDLLQGVYDDWCFYEQERCRALYLGALEQSMGDHAREGRLRFAAELGLRLLQDDPLRESVHREVMRLLYRAGDRPAALRQFSACVEVLRRELEVEPMGETSKLQRRILAEQPLDDPDNAPDDAPAASPPPRRTPVPANELESTAHDLRRAQSHISSALRRLEPSRRQPQP